MKCDKTNFASKKYGYNHGNWASSYIFEKERLNPNTSKFSRIFYHTKLPLLKDLVVIKYTCFDQKSTLF